MAMTILVPQKVENFLAIWATISFPERLCSVRLATSNNTILQGQWYQELKASLHNFKTEARFPSYDVYKARNEIKIKKY
jgi:hypothetical protein